MESYLVERHVPWGLAAAQDSKQLVTRDKRQGFGMICTGGSLTRERVHGASWLLMQKHVYMHRCVGGALPPVWSFLEKVKDTGDKM